MIAREALKHTLEAFSPDTCFVVANGYLSREAFNLDDRPHHFYMLGSMGLGPSIAFGAALARPEKTLAVLDGDGNLLMGLGALAVIGAHQPENLYHLCFDNGVYASTGNQPTVSRQVSLEGMAREAGYRRAASVDTLEDLERELAAMLAEPGPSFLRVLIDPEAHPRDFARVSHTPEEIHQRWSQSLGG